MLVTVNNQASMVGGYDGEELTVDSTVAETTLVEGMSATKTASKALWAGGTMTYTVVINNETLIDYEVPVFTDTLDSHLTFVDGSVTVAGAEYANYTFVSPLLTINLPTVPAETSLTVTFDVTQV